MNLAYADVMMHAKIADDSVGQTASDICFEQPETQTESKTASSATMQLVHSCFINLRRFFLMAGSSGLKNGFVSSSSCSVLGTVAMPCKYTLYKLNQSGDDRDSSVLLCVSHSSAVISMHIQESESSQSHAKQPNKLLMFRSCGCRPDQ